METIGQKILTTKCATSTRMNLLHGNVKKNIENFHVQALPFSMISFFRSQAKSACEEEDSTLVIIQTAAKNQKLLSFSESYRT